MNIFKSNIFKYFTQPVLDFIYPPICISCNDVLLRSNEKICSTCWNSIPTITKDHPLYIESLSKLTSAGYIDNLVSCYIFEKKGAYQHIAHALKYKEFKLLGIELGKKIGGRILDWQIACDLIIPVPLHKIKYRERGYNQSEYIAKGIAQTIGKPIITNVLKRKRYTQTQTKLNLLERQKNMEDAFEIVHKNSHKIVDKSCLLIDDIITTGATINSCAKELVTAGSKKVIAASTALAE